MRAGKVFLLLTLLAVGAGLQTALAVRGHVALGMPGCRIGDMRFRGPSFAFESETTLDLPPGTTLRLQNAFGGVRVHAGEAGRARIHLRKVVFLPDEARARAFADKLRLLAAVEGPELRVRTNRDEFSEAALEDVGLETHFEVALPAGTPVIVSNAHGPVDLADAGAVQLEASFDSVRLERIAGDAQVKVRHGDLSIAAVAGTLDVSGQHGDVELRQAAGPATLDVQHGDVTLGDTRAVQVRLRFGDLKAEQVHGALHVRGEHAGIEADQVEGPADIETGFRSVDLRRVSGDARVVNQHGSVRVEDAGGTLGVRGSHDDVQLARVKGRVEVVLEHGGLKAEDLEGGASLKTSGDAVALLGFRGPLQLEARRGDVELVPSGPLSDGVVARVENGSLTLAVPDGSRGVVDAQAEGGEITLAEVPALVLAGGGAEQATGRLGEGGAAITLRTRHGDLRIEGRPAVAVNRK